MAKYQVRIFSNGHFIQSGQTDEYIEALDVLRNNFKTENYFLQSNDENNFRFNCPLHNSEESIPQDATSAYITCDNTNPEHKE